MRRTVIAVAAAPCGKAKYYARPTITYPGARPDGVAKRDTHTLGC
jgi:hypothetical protein